MMIVSPLNYPGNKSRLLKEIIPLLPKDIDLIVEPFAGSAVISINSSSSKIICNDIDEHIIELNKYLYESTVEYVINSMNEIIKQYGFTDSTNKGNVYIEKKHEGLSVYNKKPFELLKKEYNKSHNVELLFALIIFSFNHFLRYNGNGEFNVPVGKVDFSNSLRQKTINFIKEVKNKQIIFTVGSYLNNDLYVQCSKESLVYFDPPYSITMAPYNTKWNKNDDKNLFKLFDELSQRGIKVAMSNVLLSNGKVNQELIDWSAKYNVYHLKRQYRNANYQKVNITDTDEVLITNYFN